MHCIYAIETVGISNRLKSILSLCEGHKVSILFNHSFGVVFSSVEINARDQVTKKEEHTKKNTHTHKAPRQSKPEILLSLIVLRNSAHNRMWNVLAFFPIHSQR